MPILIALAGAAVAIYFFLIRTRNTVEAVKDLSEVANDVRLAARRFGFARKSKAHPVESIDDPDIAATALIVAVQEMHDLPTKDDQQLLETQLRVAFRCSAEDAQELVTLGRWLVQECGTNDQAVYRLIRRMDKLNAHKYYPLIDQVLNRVIQDMSEKQKEALSDIERKLGKSR